ncbi:MAG: RNA-binding protein [Parvibaculaceae bacterium]
MANKSVFASMIGKLLPRADAENHEGAPAYALAPRAALAQLAATGTFNQVFYAEPREQLDEILKLAREVDAAFIAKTAIYAREKGHMKDMPAFLLAVLATLATGDFVKAFPRVITNGKMLRNFVQIVRSGAVGRKSLGSRPKRMILGWLAAASDADILRASIGNDPSLADIIRMVHPKPATKAREALYGYVIGRPYDVAHLPEIVKDFEAFKRDPSLSVPAVPFQMLTALPLTRAHWAAIAATASWQTLRQGLNTFARHGAFEVEGMAERVADKIRDPKAIAKAKAFPYQLMVAYAAAGREIPSVVREALQDAMEIAISNVPELDRRIVICPDVSGSMASPVTGHRRGATTVMRCIDVAALVAAAFVRRNPRARVLPFEQAVVDIDLNPRDTVLTNAQKLASIGGGGTNCSAPLEKLVREKARVDLVIFVSDNESWVDTPGSRYGGTATMKAWTKLKRANPQAKLVCIDIQPYATTQANERADIINIGGFSDMVFETIAAFAENRLDADHWIGEIEKIAL